MTDEYVTPVLFRISRAPVKRGPEVTAVFPTEPADTAGHYMTCYSHIGQHGSCDFGWYHTTRPARPAEYADLKAELEGEPYGYNLRVFQRINKWHRAAFKAELRSLRA